MKIKDLVSIIFKVCMRCQRYQGAIEGCGVTGISHCLCPECFDVTMGEIKARKIRQKGD